MTLSELEQLRADADTADVAFEMDEEAFRAFYDRTARGVWTYLSRLSGDAQAADDLLQETYYRFLRVRTSWDSEAHRRAYLFRIATNLVRDRHRRAVASPTVPLGDRDVAGAGDPAAVDRRADLDRAMGKLRPRDRAMLWLAYGVGQPHTEIASAVGVKTGSVKLLLFRARRKLAGLLTARPHPSAKGHDRDVR
ncbi:MAG: sigma-70 family RNA polymerase sigma factor [Vicinamibacterales bacterium]